MKINKNKILIVTLVLVSIVGLINSVFNRSRTQNTPAPYKTGKTDQTKTPSNAETEESNGGKYLVTELKALQDARELRKEHPLYFFIPIETEEIRVVYDRNKESFRIRLKISRNSTQETIDSLTDKAIEKIKELEIDEPIPYYVVFID